MSYIIQVKYGGFWSYWRDYERADSLETARILLGKANEKFPPNTVRLVKII